MKRIGLLLGCLGLIALGCGDGNGGGNGGGGNGGGGTGGNGGGTGGVGGQTACTEIGCNDGFTFTIKPGEDGTFAAGDYTLETDVDGQKETCTITIGLMTNTTCDAFVDVTNVPNQIMLTFEGTPASLGIAMTHEDAELFNVTLTPSYSEVQPNGEGCPPVCMQSQGEVTL